MVAFDARGHGETRTDDDGDLSADAQAADAADPAISQLREFLRPWLIWLVETTPRAPFAKRSRIVAASSVTIRRVSVAPREVVNVSTGPSGFCRSGSW